jgi:asparagine synthase (glutamine-hydrolysing)
MCGILGAFGGIQDQQILFEAGESLIRRGPDQSAFWNSGSATVSFHRLAVHGGLGGMQPFQSGDGNITVFCNGEIYNHHEIRSRHFSTMKFRSDSDCEILPHLYQKFGIDFIRHLNGMFFIVLIDELRKKAFLIRDRLGIKPAFWMKVNGVSYFASEIKALKKIPGAGVEFDRDAALDEAWLNGKMVLDTTRPRSLFKNVEMLPGGHYLEFDLSSGHAKEVQYWSVPDEDQNIDEVEAQKVYLDLLKDSVALSTRDLPSFGLFLSGGIDSQALSTLAAGHHAAATCKNMATVRNGDFQSAVEFAKAKELDLLISEFPLQAQHLSLKDWRKLLEVYETPFFGPEQIFKFYLIMEAKSHYPLTKVWLTGQGSDEFNGGYSPLYVGETENFEEGWDFFLFGLERFALKGEDRGDAFLNYRLSKMRDLQMYNLWHEDRTTSWFGLETRVPFLDHRLVEWTFKIPKSLHAPLFWNKRILRNGVEALDGLGRFSMSSKPKRPFFYGDGEAEVFEYLGRSIQRANPSRSAAAWTIHDFRRANMDLLAGAGRIWDRL